MTVGRALDLFARRYRIPSGETALEKLQDVVNAGGGTVSPFATALIPQLTPDEAAAFPLLRSALAKNNTGAIATAAVPLYQSQSPGAQELQLVAVCLYGFTGGITIDPVADWEQDLTVNGAGNQGLALFWRTREAGVELNYTASKSHNAIGYSFAVSNVAEPDVIDFAVAEGSTNAIDMPALSAAAGNYREIAIATANAFSDDVGSVNLGGSGLEFGQVLDQGGTDALFAASRTWEDHAGGAFPASQFVTDTDPGAWLAARIALREQSPA